MLVDTAIASAGMSALAAIDEMLGHPDVAPALFGVVAYAMVVGIYPVAILIGLRYDTV